MKMWNPFLLNKYLNPLAVFPFNRPSKVDLTPIPEISKTTAAERIQKCFRQFVMRKNVSKIAIIKKQVDEMEAKFSLLETVDLVRKDNRERLMFNETLMKLLLKLDSVRGVDSRVKNFRKAVIKKVIVLQERLDAIVSEDLNKEIVEVDDIIEIEDEDTSCTEGESEEETYDAEGQEEDLVEMEEIEKEESFDVSEQEEEDLVETEDIEKEASDFAEQEEEDLVETEDIEKEESCDVAEQEEEDLVETEEIEKETVKEWSQETVSDDGMEMEQDQQQEPDSSQEKCNGVDQEEEYDEEKEMLMEKMMETNERLIGMVTELCEKNEMQTEMINSLSKKVDSLHQAFKRSNCKKRKRATAGLDHSTKNVKKFSAVLGEIGR